ncbi:MAG: hypothetical protein ACJ76V_12475 [Thermoleophilaceae bacterium]
MNRSVLAFLLAMIAAALLAPVASASDVQHLHFRYGPINVKPGSNQILTTGGVEKPSEDGYITKIVPNLKRTDGSVPGTQLLHLHHGVWLNASRRDPSTPAFPFEKFFAAGEEKTSMTLPAPYGYPVKASDVWVLNYMIHDLVTRPFKVYITYDVDFVPANSALGKTMKPVRPIWMDVQNNHAYPVFDVHKGSGRNGRFTYPDQDTNAYPAGTAPLNQWTADRPMTLVAMTMGHVHPGGLWDDLDVLRAGAVPNSAKGVIPGAGPHSARIFRSKAKYYDPNGPVSWDMSLPVSKPSWRVHLNQGDTLRISTTYDSKHASWYEAMGIMIAYATEGDDGGPDPFQTAVDTKGRLTHGHLRENDAYGGRMPSLPNAKKLPGRFVKGNRVQIQGYKFLPGDLRSSLGKPYVPEVKQGQSLRFVNGDGAPGVGFLDQVSHSITSCAFPCNLSTGISYPIANGRVFDSGQMGFGPIGLTAFNNKQTWESPRKLRAGTYTFFCRIHPFMRGAFRVVK